MDKLDQYNIVEIKHFVLYILKKSTNKDYIFINKMIYLIYQSQLMDTCHPVVKDIFIVRDDIPYLRILDVLMNTNNLPDSKPIRMFKKSIELKDGKLISHSKPNMDYISKYTKDKIDESFKSTEYTDYVDKYFHLDTYKLELNPADIVYDCFKEMMDSVNQTLLLEESQFYPKWLNKIVEPKV